MPPVLLLRHHTQTRPHPLSQGEKQLSRISWASAHFCNSVIFNILWKPAQKKDGYSNGDEQNVTVVRKVPRNNYWFHNLIGPYHFWVISLRNLTPFTRPLFTGRHMQDGHETNPNLIWRYVLLLLVNWGCQGHFPTHLLCWKFIQFKIINNAALLYTFQQHTSTPTTSPLWGLNLLWFRQLSEVFNGWASASQCHMDIDKIPNYIFWKIQFWF